MIEPQPNLGILFIDFNAYFASVEQQARPELRGRPVAVAPVEAETTCCIAASYEAKKFGVKTGDLVMEARRKCPGIRLVRARPSLYVQYHQRLLEAIDLLIPVDRILSIDEVSCRLDPRDRTPERAAGLARRIKATIAERVGECMRCSIGIAPNRILAKVASDMQKPDGLVVIERRELPGRLAALDLTDLPGVGPRMRVRLHRHGVTSMEQLCSMTPGQLEEVWESVVGRYWWHWLRGDDLPEKATRRRSIGHQHVLAPELRTDAGAWGVAVRLLHKAAARARHLGYRAQRLSLSVGCEGEKGRGPVGWGRFGTHAAVAHLDGGCQDTLSMIGVMRAMWESRPPGTPRFVDVTLFDLIAESVATLPLFEGERGRERLARAIDRLDAKYGKLTVYAASMQDAKEAAPGGIAFSNVPDLALPDSVE